MSRFLRLRWALAASLLSLSCSRFGPVYPSRPAPAEAAVADDPRPARVVAHLAIASAALRRALDDAVPKTGEGTVHVLGGDRKYTWERGPIDLGFSQGRIALKTSVAAKLAVPLKTLEFPFDLQIQAEPIISSDYAVKLQSVDVQVRSSDTGLAVVDRFANIYDRIASAVGDQLKTFSYDLRPIVSEAYARVASPISLPLGDATACARRRVLDVEAGPTVLADGIEKDMALVVAPSITLPCAGADDPAPPLPPLSNVATVVPGPFTVTIPIAARYDELTRAMSSAFTDGKLFFSKEYPALYLEKPEIYESEGQLVLKLHLHGPARGLGIDTDLDGDLFLAGHAQVVDNELSIPDLEPTIETHNFLLSLKALADGDRIRSDARQALRLDIGERLRGVREKLGKELTFERDDGCFRGDVDSIEVTGVYPHASYVRILVTVVARARLEMPCAAAAMPAAPEAPAPAPPPATSVPTAP